MALSQLFDPEPEVSATSPANDSNRAKGRQSQQSIRQTLSQALELKELAYNTAKAIQLPQGSALDSQESRAIAQSVTALCKAFADMVTIIRIERGKPLPGSLRPESKSKPKKAKPNTFTEE